MFFVTISVIFTSGRNEADQQGFVPRAKNGLSHVKEADHHRIPTVEGGRRRSGPMNTVPAVMMRDRQQMVSGRVESHSQGLCFPNTTPGRQEIRQCHSSPLMIKGRISLRPEAGRWENDRGKVGQEGNGGRS